VIGRRRRIQRDKRLYQMGEPFTNLYERRQVELLDPPMLKALAAGTTQCSAM
jgi:hypothetical protein